MFRKGYPFLALSVALASATDSPDPLDTIRAGTYSHSTARRQNLRLLNWNIDRGKHLDGIFAAIHETKPDLCVFQEVDLGARRTRGMDVAQELAKTTGMNY
jgi:hypothetical protein